MLDLLDVKKAVLGCALSASVGGGFYGLYIKNISAAALSEVHANEMLQDCMVLKADKAAMPVHVKEIESLFVEADRRLPAIGKADVVLGIVTGSLAPSKPLPGYSGSLRQCIGELKVDFEPTRKELGL